ncbi:MAG: hypothetical protein R3Y15_07400 [Rikenellaceae bacterium]
MKKFAVIILLCLFLADTFAQELEVTWDVEYEWLFDNREYKSDYAIPQTIFGSRLQPQLGLSWDDNNSLNIGGEVFISMGKEGYFDNFLPLMYYDYDNDKYNFAAGVIPRSKMLGNYPTAFFSDSTNFYRPIIEGCLFNYQSGRGYFEFGCSWVGLLSEDRREQFLIFSSAEMLRGRLFAGYYFTMMHYAMRKGEHGVVDNMLALPYVGVNIGGIGNVIDDSNLSVGAMAAFQRDRAYDDARYPLGLYVNLNLQKWRFGLENTLYLGENLMPFYYGHEDDYYGADLYYGDPYYQTSSVYNRLEVFFEAISTKRVSMKIATVHHYDGSVLDWQQVLKLTVNLGGKF